MARWKATFMSAYVAVASAAAAIAATRALRGPDRAAWLGATVGVGGLPAFVGVSMALKPAARTSETLPALTGSAAVGLAAAVGTKGGRPPVAFAGLGLAGALVYTKWYSYFGRTRAASIDVGQPLPEFHLTAIDGTPVSSHDYLGLPAVFVFIRGNWCPLCVAQVREMAESYRALEARGARVALVSPQPADETRKLARRFDAPMDFLVDRDCAAARQLRILHDHGTPTGLQLVGYDTDTVLPTVLVVAADGTILLSDQTDNYRVRPEPSTYLEVLDAAGQ